MEKQLERNNTPKTLIFDRKMLEDKEYWTEKLSVEREPTSLRYDHLEGQYRLNTPSPGIAPRTMESAPPNTVGTGLAPVHPSVAPVGGQGQALSLRDLSQKLIKLTQGKPLLVYTTLASALMVCLHKY